jgi:LacI family transcriptional regulator
MPLIDRLKTRTAGKVTIRTVAADAGVSVAAVSKVLRNAYGVSDDMRQKVNSAIAKLGYRPSKPARGLRGSTFTIGVLLVDIDNPFLPQIISSINEELSASDYQAMIGVGRAQEALETSLIDSMIDHKMDGVILVAPRLPSAVISAFASQVPIVTIGHHAAEATAYDTINADDQRGAEIAIEALAAEGFRDIAMYTLRPTEGYKGSVVDQREIGYRNAMARLGLQEHIRLFEIPMQQVKDGATLREQVITGHLDRTDRPRAIFCWSDLDAVLVLACAKKLNINVPGDLAIVGFDNSPVAAYPMLDLASIDQAGPTLGQLATRALLTRIAGRTEPKHIKVEPTLVRRGSMSGGL